ncbi:hypothetical protein C0Q70_16861 [Pomacea canaliculata]|uniref:Bromo domain-containing protein n=1 Tax=Pomacea canaliculata TaxID=400727 RepID=A0A2T7NQY9_POMCA|nr:hypothetical protein C0Q70_16861 [Pomacea canaliculata]
MVSSSYSQRTCVSHSFKRKAFKAEILGNESDHSAIGYHEEHSIFEEKIVESRLRPRVGPRRAYNYVYEDSSDDDTALLISSRRRRARVVNEAPFQMPGSRRRRRHDVCELEHTSEEDGDEDSPHQRRARKLSQVEGDGEDGELCSDMDDDEEEEDLNNCALRRSSRLRQKPYRFRPMAEEITSHGPGDSSNVGGNERGKRQRPSDPPDNPDEEYGDMYSRVKRARNKKTVGHECNNSISNTDGSNDEGDDKQDTEDEAQQRRSYSLREHKPRTQLYIAPAIEGIRKKPKQQSMFRETPPRRLNKHATYRSPAHRNAKFRKRETFHGSSTSTSDSSDSGTETTDEQRFNRRKAKSIAKSRNRIMPLNFPNDTVGTSAVMKDRLRAGASSADVDPMEIDTSVNFDSIGGLKQHLMALKEMIVFPLLYPEFYERFKVEPSRGVLFYGPPGGQRVAFFMRKGADCLSKWVGEAERQLRLLFDKAYEMRPSIIFFDEIDGLAPVRSSRQDQIHNSIVSTLLALMDGLDSRGEIVVIGATNRIDAIDPAFRRPGRFDREFRFPFPNLEDRKKILKIHTRNWKPSLRDEFISELAEKCAGYSGADIKCLVTDATQNALRRHYPQIYTTFEKLQLDVGAITLTARDFARALVNIVPAAQRTVLNPAVALEPSMRPLLQRALCTLSSALAIQFPYARFKRKVELLDLPQAGSSCEEDSQEKLAYQELSSDEEENAPSIFMPHNKNHAFSHKTAASDLSSEPSFIKFSSAMSRFPILYRPRMLVSGESGQGQTVHLAPAALHFMEHLPVYTLCSAAIFAATAKMPEEACANIFYEAQRTAPSIIYMPSINELWAVVSDTLRSTFLSLVHNMQPSTPVLLFATSELPYSLLDEQLKMLFNKAGGQVVEAEVVTSEERNQYFSDLILLHPLRPPPTHKQAAQCILQVLPKAAPPEPRKLTEREECRLLEQEEDTLRELRIFLRDILSKLGREKKFLIFTKPVDVEDVPDYYDIIKNPMDLSMMMSKIDLHKYSTASAFMDDIYLICSNALEYNPDKGPTDRAIRHRACALRDTAEALLKAELDPDFEKICQEITQSRKRRGVDSSGMVPAFCHTCPLTLSTNDSSTSASKNPSHILQVPEGSRYSRRVRGLDVDNVVPLDLVEKSAQLEKSLLGKTSAMDVDGGETHMYRVGMEHQTQEDSLDTEEEPSSSEKVSSVLSAKPSNSSHTEKNSFKAHCETRPVSSSMIKKMNMRKKCPWLATRRRRRTHSAFSQKDSHSPGSDVDVVSADESEGTVNPCHEQNRQEERVEHIEHEQLPQAPENANNSAVIALKQNSMQSLTRRSNCAGSSSSPAAFGTPVQNHLPSISCTQSHDSCMMQTMQPASTSAANSSEGSNPAASQRPAAAKKLEVDLNAVSTDSGVGSSLDSNGDSRDSIEHNNNNNTGSVTRQETPDHGEENSADKSTAGLACARTRSRTQTAIQQSAFHALEAVMPSIRIDKDRLSQLLEYTVRQTHHCTVEKLLQLYSILSRIIFRHRHQHDKTQLVQEMEEAVETFCGNARLQ